MKHKFESIQFLRFMAAGMVAVTHITFYLQTRVDPELTIWKIGSQGVQIFFVISGFVMVLASGALTNRPADWRDFLIQRLIRIVPAYWILNLLKLVALSVIPTALFAEPDSLNILLSILFIPSKNANGVIETFFGPGWTLNFEMLFYAIIATCLLLRRSLFKYSIATLSAFAVLSLFRTDEWAALTYFFHPYVLNFIWGMIIAYLFDRMTPNPLICFTFLLSGTYIIFLSPPPNTMAWGGVQYFLIVSGAIGLEPYISGKLPKILIFGGDSSYSLYLTQAISGVIAAYIITSIGIESVFLASTLMLALILLFSSVFYVAIERPITTILKEKYSASQNLKRTNSSAEIP